MRGYSRMHHAHVAQIDDVASVDGGAKLFAISTCAPPLQGRARPLTAHCRLYTTTAEHRTSQGQGRGGRTTGIRRTHHARPRRTSGRTTSTPTMAATPLSWSSGDASTPGSFDVVWPPPADAAAPEREGRGLPPGAGEGPPVIPSQRDRELPTVLLNPGRGLQVVTPHGRVPAFTLGTVRCAAARCSRVKRG